MDKGAWTKEPTAEAYGQSLRGFGVNLLVTDIATQIDFASRVLMATCLMQNDQFAILQYGQSQWMLHQDSTYKKHPLSGLLAHQEGRGIGVELRLYDTDPDLAEARARERGDTVLAGSLDKPHGMRECYLLGPDGYCWVLSKPTG